MEVDFFLQQIAQFDKSINLFCLVFLTLEFSFSVYFFTTDAIRTHCFYIMYSKEVSEFLISSLISLYSLNSLFTETNSS